MFLLISEKLIENIMNSKKKKKISILFNGLLELAEDGEIIDEVAGIKQMALKNLPESYPEISIILAIAEQAAMERDMQYIDSEHCLERFGMIGLNGVTIKQLIRDIWGDI